MQGLGEVRVMQDLKVHQENQVSEAYLENQDSRAEVAFQLLLDPEVNKEQWGFKVQWDLKASQVVPVAPGCQACRVAALASATCW